MSELNAVTLKKVREAMAKVENIGDDLWELNGTKIRQTKDGDFYMPRFSRRGRFATIDACVLLITIGILDPKFVVPLPKWEDEAFEYECIAIEESLQAEIKALKAMDDLEAALNTAVALEEKIDRLVLETWVTESNGENYKVNYVRPAMNIARHRAYEKREEEKAITVGDECAALALGRKLDTAGIVYRLGHPTAGDVTNVWVRAGDYRKAWELYTGDAPIVPVAGVAELAQELDPVAGAPETRIPQVTEKVQEAARTMADAYGTRIGAAPAPIIEATPFRGLKVVGFVTVGVPTKDQIAAGLKMLETKEEANVNQSKVDLLAVLMDAGVSAYLLATAMLKTDVEIHLPPAPASAVAPNEHGREVLNRIAKFAELAGACVNEHSPEMAAFALKYTLEQVVKEMDAGGLSDPYVVAGVLGRLLKYLTRRDTTQIAGDLRLWDRLRDRDMTPMEGRLWQAYLQLDAEAAAAFRKGVR